ncbi:unnamed protein product, partial [Iphiclides podalirius]
MSLAIFHLFAAAINTYVIWYDQTYVELPLENELLKTLPLKSRSMFLTIWCLIIQTVYHTIAFLNDVFGSTAASPRSRPLIRSIRDTLFSLAFPIALYVSTAFWAIYAVDKDLIFPDHIEKLYPTWVNHVMHTTVSVFMFVELLLASRNYPSRKIGVSIITAFNLAYMSWFLTIYFNTGAWVYPVFEPLNWPMRVVFLILSHSTVVGFYLIGEKLNYLANPNTKAYTNGTVTEASPKKKR